MQVELTRNSVPPSGVRSRDNQLRNKQSSEPTFEIEDSNTATDSDDSNVDEGESRSSVGEKHFIHATPYHKNGLTSLLIAASSIYAQLLVVVCIVLVLTEVVKEKNNNGTYSEAFFTYLYSVAILFFIYVFGYLLRREKLKKTKVKKNMANAIQNASSVSVTVLTSDPHYGRNNEPVSSSLPKMKKIKTSKAEHSHGSFLLRAGAVAFGLGTVIYDGLEFGAFFERSRDSPCYVPLKGLNPILHAVFTFLQMYFIFVSARLRVHRFKAVARFGLMHCVATNVSVWIRTLVRESLREITEHIHSENNNNGTNHSENIHHSAGSHDESLNEACERQIYLGTFIADASPYLYPFLIEYSLIGAAVLYVVWAHIGVDAHNKVLKERPIRLGHEASDHASNSSRHELRIDCTNSHKGLFLGLFCLAVCLLSLVLFLVFSHQPHLRKSGLFLADSTHCFLLFFSVIAMAIGVYRAKGLEFHPAAHTEELGDILLRVSAIGIFLYSVFSMVAGALTPHSSEEPPVLVLITGFLTAAEVTGQLLFISDMSRRKVGNAEQDRSKPGRQTVIFLLVINLASWLMYTFEAQKSEANPVQLNFYGFLAWTVLQRLTLPMCIFYRFHSVIVHAEIWKNTYRLKN